MKRWDERAICSSLSMNRMAKMPEMLEPIGRPSVWRKMRSSKMKYMLLSVTLSSSATSSLDRWNVLCSILLTVLSMASWMASPIYAYRETPFISSRAKPVANITSEARHDSYMTEQKNTWPTTTRR